MDYFVTLDVEEPVAFAGGLGDVGLVGVFHPAGVFVEVPDGVDDANFVGIDAPDLVEGFVVGVAVSQGDDELIDNRQDGGNCLFDGVIKLGRIANHREATDCHSQIFWFCLGDNVLFIRTITIPTTIPSFSITTPRRTNSVLSWTEKIKRRLNADKRGIIYSYVV